MSNFLFLQTTVSEDISSGPGKDASSFQKGQVTRLHQAKNTTKKTAETSKIRLRSAKGITDNPEG